jgi:YihY family inner membrane protein
VLEAPQTLLPHVGRFALRVVRRFQKNNGILLASAVGYNFALSMVPLFALVLIALSHFLAEEQLLEIVSTQVRLLVPGEPEATRETLRSLFVQRHGVGLISLGAMLVFSSLAFRMLEGAILTIFHRHRPRERRTVLVSVILPFAFTLAIMLALIGVTTVIAMIDIHGEAMGLPASSTLLTLAAYGGLVAVFFAFYRLIPIGKISSKRALAGAFVAGSLWEVVRRLMQWYFTSLSLVGVLYGSLSTVVVILLSMEVAAVIVLLGAQVIAELEVSSAAGVPWHVEPEPRATPSPAPPAT